jgi:hypothetical protein
MLLLSERREPCLFELASHFSTLIPLPEEENLSLEFLTQKLYSSQKIISNSSW